MSSTPQTLTVVDQGRLLYHLRNEKGTIKQVHRGLRNYSMALLMLETGVRVGELIKLTWSDLYFDSRPCISTIIRAEIAKNQKERIIPISVRLCEALTEYHLHYSPQIQQKQTDYLFFVMRPSNPLSVRHVERIITRAGSDCLGRPINPHLLRHTFATRLIRVTNVRTLQLLLGHTCIKSTQVYTHPSHEDLALAIQASEKFTRDLEDSLPPSALSSSPADPRDAVDADQDHGQGVGALDVPAT